MKLNLLSFSPYTFAYSPGLGTRLASQAAAPVARLRLHLFPFAPIERYTIKLIHPNIQSGRRQGSSIQRQREGADDAGFLPLRSHRPFSHGAWPTCPMQKEEASSSSAALPYQPRILEFSPPMEELRVSLFGERTIESASMEYLTVGRGWPWANLFMLELFVLSLLCLYLIFPPCLQQTPLQRSRY